MNENDGPGAEDLNEEYDNNDDDDFMFWHPVAFPDKTMF